MNKFVFKQYSFDSTLLTASFKYGFQNGLEFEEKVQFASASDYDKDLLDKALFLSFILVGTSYYKLFPSTEIELTIGSLDSWQVDFFNKVYQEGLSQFAYENNLTRQDLAHFSANAHDNQSSIFYDKKGIIALQSGGKDSLLTASLLTSNQQSFTPWYVSSSLQHPAVLDTLGENVRTVKRQIDTAQITEGLKIGGLNGHVPVTYIVYSYAIIDAILSGNNVILASIGHEGEEPHAWVDDLPVNHQWSKTWSAEQVLVDYVHRYISSDLKIGSPLRGYSELKVAELFVKHSWPQFEQVFSSCNLANYKQGSNNTQLKWCGNCPKCASSFLLFSPFLPANELKKLFDDRDLFTIESLQNTFKGLLGIDGVIKPFECVGEIDELRLAYQLAQARGGYDKLPFNVPHSAFDYESRYPSQQWAAALTQPL